MSMSLPEIEAQLKQLRQLVVRDQLSSNAYSLNEKGELEEVLSGKLEAKGVIFQEGEFETTASASIVWVEDGQVMERIVGSANPVDKTHTLTLATLEPSIAELHLTGSDEPEENEATLSIGSTGRLLLNGAGESSFLQIAGLTGPRKLQINVGEATASWKDNLGGVTVAHRLGVEPIYANAVLLEGGEIFYDTNPIGLTSVDETHFTFAWSPDGVEINSGTSLVRWIAVG